MNKCGDSSPLSIRVALLPKRLRRQVGAVQTLARVPLWLVLSGLLLTNLAAAQSYSLDWSTLDGGGGTSTGGVYSVSGTIGQPDAGAMSGGSFTLVGGFWGIVAALQTPGARLLTITLNTQLSTLNNRPIL